MNDKVIFGIVTVCCVTIMQVVAWDLGFTGQVFSFTSLIIGLVAGSILGFSFNIKKSIKEYVDNNHV